MRADPPPLRRDTTGNHRGTNGTTRQGEFITSLGFRVPQKPLTQGLRARLPAWSPAPRHGDCARNPCIHPFFILHPSPAHNRIPVISRPAAAKPRIISALARRDLRRIPAAQGRRDSIAPAYPQDTAKRVCLCHPAHRISRAARYRPDCAGASNTRSALTRSRRAPEGPLPRSAGVTATRLTTAVVDSSTA